MKNFEGMKNIRRFAEPYITQSGTTRRNLSGIFYALLIIISVSTPVWSVNAPTALRVECNGKEKTDSDFGSVPPCGALMRPLLCECKVAGKAEPIFIFCLQRTLIMSIPCSHKECSNGITTPHKTRTPTKRVSDYHPFNSAQEFRSFYRAVAEQESDLKNETWAFLVHKKLYQEYMVWRKANRTKLILAGIIKGIKVG